MSATLSRVQPLAPSALLGRLGAAIGMLNTQSATTPEANLDPAPPAATVSSPDAPMALPSGSSDSGGGGGDGGTGTGGGEGDGGSGGGEGGGGEGGGGDGGPGGAAGDP
jgi:hypothetical protein